MKNGADLARAALVQLNRRLFDGRQTADARADHNARALTALFVLRRPAGVLHRLVGGRHGVENEVVDALAILGGHHRVRVEAAGHVGTAAAASVNPGHFAGHLTGVVGGVEGGDPSGP